MAKYWQRTLRVLEQQLPAKDYSAWIAPIRPGEVAGGTATLEVPNGFFRDWVRQYFMRELTDAVSEAHGEPCRVALVVNRELGPERVMRSPAPRSDPPRTRRNPVIGQLVPHYTLEAFVLGAANELAGGAARGVVAEPGHRYNPLFIHGGVGLGKTHVLNAIGHGVLDRRPRARVGCLSAEAFVNEMISALRRDQMDGFRRRFRRIDVLIIDDVQFLGGKKRSQEEFSHTFNALHDGRKQIVVASDRAPHEIPDLDECLRSRFASGLRAAIGAPDAALRAAIIERKAASCGLDLDQELSELIAESACGNVRELEGVLNAIRARASIGDLPVTREMIRDVLGTTKTRSDAGRVASEVVEAVAAEFGIGLEELTSSRRSARIVEARQVAIYLCRELTELSLTSIGKQVGGRDHSTVLYSLAGVAKRCRERAAFRERVERLRDRLRDG